MIVHLAIPPNKVDKLIKIAKDNGFIQGYPDFHKSQALIFALRYLVKQATKEIAS